MTLRTRFAPSPTGQMHLGHVYSALLNFRRAREAGGQFILRMEDIDQTRSRPAFIDGIYEDLHWLGLSWPMPVRIQSHHMEQYETVLEALKQRGLLYRCFKSRKDIEEMMQAPHAAPGQPFTSQPLPASEEAALLAQGAPYAWRLSMAEAAAQLGNAFNRLVYHEETLQGVVARPAAPEQFGDVVLGRKESGTSYHLASVHDDALQGITHIIRGEELRAAAGLHALLYALLGYTPPVYRHHGMLINASGQRLSKRDGALAIRTMRDAGRTPESIVHEAFAMAAGC